MDRVDPRDIPMVDPDQMCRHECNARRLQRLSHCGFAGRFRCFQLASLLAHPLDSIDQFLDDEEPTFSLQARRSDDRMGRGRRISRRHFTRRQGARVARVLVTGPHRAGLEDGAARWQEIAPICWPQSQTGRREQDIGRRRRRKLIVRSAGQPPRSDRRLALGRRH